MRNMRLVAWHEFRRYAWRWQYWLTLVGLPLLLVVGLIVFAWAGTIGVNDPVGVVDETGTMLPLEGYNRNSLLVVPLQGFADQTAARAALAEGEIQGYLHLPPHYLETGEATFYYQGNLYSGVYAGLEQYIRRSLLVNEPDIIRSRFSFPVAIEFVSLAEESEITRSAITAFLLFLLVLFLFGIFYFNVGYLLQALVNEKENRTIEIMMTTIRPFELVLGKVVGLSSLGFVYLVVWLLLPVGIAHFGFGMPLDYGLVGLLLLWFTPFYIALAAAVVIIGVVVADLAEAQLIFAMGSLLLPLPLYAVFFGVVLDPDSMFSQLLTLLPLSSPVAVVLRYQLTAVPFYQYLLSWALLMGTTIFLMYAAARLMEIGLFRYDQRVSWREAGRQLARWRG